MKKKEEMPFPEEWEAKELTVFKDITKESITQKSADIIEQVNEGHVGAIDTFIKVRAIKEVADNILQGIKSSVIEDVDNLHVNERHMHGVELQLTNGRTTHGFDHSDEWNELKDALDVAMKAKKAYEKLMIQAIEVGGLFDKKGVAVEPAIVSGGTSRVLKTIIPKG